VFPQRSRQSGRAGRKKLRESLGVRLAKLSGAFQMVSFGGDGKNRSALFVFYIWIRAALRQDLLGLIHWIFVLAGVQSGLPVDRLIAEFLLDAEQLIVFGDAIGAAK